MAGISFFRERVAYKAGDSFINPTWDLVDAIKADSTLLKYPELLQKLAVEFENTKQLKDYVDNKYHMRESYREVIKLRYEMIKKYIGEGPGDKDLDLTLKAIVNKEGRRRDFEFRTE